MDDALRASDLALIVAGVFGAVLIIDVTLFILARPVAWAEQLLVAFVGLLALTGTVGGVVLSRMQAQRTV